MKSVRRIATTAIAATATAALVAAPLASADAAGHARGDGGGGTKSESTRVVIAPAVYNGVLVPSGIGAAPLGTATAGGFKNTIRATFPITKVLKGSQRVLHSGGLKLSAGDVRIAFRKFTIDAANGKVSALVAGSIGKAGRVEIANVRPTSRPNYGAVDLNLTAAGAKALNATFDVDVFSQGARLGYATPSIALP